MGKFLLGVLVGLLLFFLFLMFGGGKTVKKFGENLTETGKRMEVMEETIKRDKETVENTIKRKFFKDDKEAPKKVQ
jgi:hypothetical protein